MKIGTTELLIILAVVLLIFGPSQIPKLTRMVGRRRAKEIPLLRKKKKRSEYRLRDYAQKERK